MQTVWIILLTALIASLIASYFLKGKKVKETVKEILGVGKRKVAKLLSEFRRKTFHLFGLLIPGLYYYGLKYGFLSKYSTSLILGILAGLMVFIEFLRFNFDSVRQLFMLVVGHNLRAEESKHRMTGTTYFLIGSFLTVFFFNPTVAIASLLFLILGDLSAALVGRAYGNTKLYNWGKSLEGSLACFVTSFCFAVATFSHLPLYEYLSLSGAIAATLAELIPKIDDNLTVPLISGFVMTGVQWRIQNFCNV